MTTPYQKCIAFILLTSMLLQSCNMDLPVAGQKSGSLNNISEERGGDTILSEIPPSGSLDAPSQDVQPEDRQVHSCCSYNQPTPQRTTATSIASSGITRASSSSGQIKCKRLAIRRKDIIQGGSLYEKERDATESSVAKCVEDNIVVTWKEKAGKYEDTVTCSIFNPSSCKMEPLSARRTPSSGEVVFPLNLSTTQSSILFEAEIKRKSLKASSSFSRHIVIGGLSKFILPDRYSLEVYTNSELPFTIPAKSDDSVKIIHLEEGKVSEKIEALKNQVKETTQEQGVQTEETEVTAETQEQGVQTEETEVTAETQERGVQTEETEQTQGQVGKAAEKGYPRRPSRTLIMYTIAALTCSTAILKVLKLLNDRKA